MDKENVAHQPVISITSSCKWLGSEWNSDVYARFNDYIEGYNFNFNLKPIFGKLWIL